jgi:hypothetical protein
MMGYMTRNDGKSKGSAEHRFLMNEKGVVAIEPVNNSV